MLINKTAAAFAILLSSAFSQVVITEVSPNPPGTSTAIPGDLSHEFVEVFNAGATPVNLCGYYLKTSSSGSIAAPDSNNLQVWQGDSLRDIGGDSALVYDSILLPGAYAVILGRKYISAPESSWYKIRAGASVFATRKTYLKSGGLSNSSAVVELFSERDSRVSAFNGFSSTDIDPGEGLTWQRVHADSSDALLNWKPAPPTPGGPYPYASLRKYATTLRINEFMCDPATGGAEWVELFNHGTDTANLLGWKIRTGDEESYLSLSAIPVPPGGYAVAREPGVFSDRLLAGLLCPLLLPSAWGGLSRNGDDIVLRDESGNTVDSLTYTDNEFDISKGVSQERASVGQAASSWKASQDPMGATPGFGNSVLSPETAFSFGVSNRRIIPGCSNGFSLINMTLEAPSGGELSLKIYDLKGRLVKSLYDKAKGVSSGYEFWDGKNQAGLITAPGVYIVYCEYHGGSRTTVRKIPVALGGRCDAP